MIIQSKNVYVDEKLQPLQIEIKDNKIVNVMPYGCINDVVDYGDAIILPGFIDMHNHGYNGGTCNRASKEWLREWASYLPSEGITSAMFGFSCGDLDELMKSLHNFDEVCNEGTVGAQFIGAYSEGPYVGGKPGAQNTNYKLIPDSKNVDAFNDACGGRLVYVMLAPEELKGNYDVIKYCRQKGIKVALGHTDATFEECAEAIEAGASSFTHTYNGMNGLHHRKPGVVGAAMYHEDCYCELICDGIHVNKYAANILARIKGKDKLMLITDSVSIKGNKPGIYGEGKDALVLGEDGSVTQLDGTICGSMNKLNKVLRYAIKEAKIDPVTAYNAVSKNPFEFLGIPTKGKIAKGFDADIAILNDDYDVITTYIAGKEYKTK